MREELFWDRNMDDSSAEVVIERAINFGGFDFIDEVQRKYGMQRFIHTLTHNRNLSKKAVNYWCMKLSLDRTQTRAFRDERIWEPF